jgi:hypothetical protein
VSRLDSLRPPHCPERLPLTNRPSLIVLPTGRRHLKRMAPALSFFQINRTWLNFQTLQLGVQKAGFNALDGTKDVTSVGIMPNYLFFIGTGKTFSVHQPGTLFLGINDCLVGDNSGGSPHNDAGSFILAGCSQFLTAAMRVRRRFLGRRLFSLRQGLFGGLPIVAVIRRL